MVFLKISQNSQENTCARASLFLSKVAGLRPVTFLKKRLLHNCFPVSFVKNLYGEIFKNIFFIQNTHGGCLCNARMFGRVPLCSLLKRRDQKFQHYRSSHRRCFIKKVVLKGGSLVIQWFSGSSVFRKDTKAINQKLYQSLVFNKAAG